MSSYWKEAINAMREEKEVKEEIEGKVSVMRDEVNSFVSSFSKKNEEYNAIFSELMGVTDKFGDNLQENLKLLVSMEFLIVRLRIFVSNDLNLCNSILANSSDYSLQVNSLVKKRISYLVSLNTRLTDIREDYNSAQKLCYTLGMKNF